MKLKNTCSLEENLWQTYTEFLKSRDITLPTKVCIVQAMVFPVVMYGCESWTIKKAEYQNKEWMLLNCGVAEDSWESLRLQGDQTNQSKRKLILIIGRTDVEVPILCQPVQRADSLEKIPDASRVRARGEGGDRGWNVWMHHWLSGLEFEQTQGESEGHEGPVCFKS